MRAVAATTAVGGKAQLKQTRAEQRDHARLRRCRLREGTGLNRLTKVLPVRSKRNDIVKCKEIDDQAAGAAGKLYIQVGIDENVAKCIRAECEGCHVSKAKRIDAIGKISRRQHPRLVAACLADVVRDIDGEGAGHASHNAIVINAENFVGVVVRTLVVVGERDGIG